jgi:predicted DNA-binding WGR domain protein
MRVYMQTNIDDEKSARYYQLVLQEDLLEGWTLVREWGQLGSAGRVKRDNFGTHAEAQHALLLVRDAQLKRGYHVIFMQGMDLT